MTSAEKQHTLELAERYVCPDRVRFLTGAGIDLVIGRREGCRIWDVDGRELIDIHLNETRIVLLAYPQSLGDLRPHPLL